MSWYNYPEEKKQKLLLKTKPRTEREYKQQLHKFDLRQQQLEEFRDRRRRINDLFNLDKLIRGVKTKVQVELDRKVRHYQES